MKSPILIPLALAMGFGLSSCANASKKKATADAGILGKLSETKELNEETVNELLSIANDPNSSLQDSDIETSDIQDSSASESEIEFASQEGIARKKSGVQKNEITFDPVKKWATNGMNPASVNPGDIFSESAGPVLNKALSLSDELPETERDTILSQIASHKTKRLPITFSQKEINTLRSRVPAETLLPTRSVALDVKTHIRAVETKRFERFLEKLAAGDSGDSISSADQRKKLQGQLAEVKARLKKGEDLFIITEVTESENIRAHFPGAPIGSRDAEPIRNAVQSLYPHLSELGSTKEDDRVVLTGDPRLLWEFESKALKLKNGNVVIEEVSKSKLAQR